MDDTFSLTSPEYHIGFEHFFGLPSSSSQPSHSPPPSYASICDVSPMPASPYTHSHESSSSSASDYASAYDEQGGACSSAEEEPYFPEAFTPMFAPSSSASSYSSMPQPGHPLSLSTLINPTTPAPLRPEEENLESILFAPPQRHPEEEEDSSGSSSPRPDEESDDDDDEEEEEEGEKTRYIISPESIIGQLDKYFTTDPARVGKTARGSVKVAYLEPIVWEIITTFPLESKSAVKTEIKRRGMVATDPQIKLALKTRYSCIRRVKTMNAQRTAAKKRVGAADELRKENKVLKAKLKAMETHMKKSGCYDEFLFGMK